jgi:two-component system nitrogen regulation sensor histidine kinase GlnL
MFTARSSENQSGFPITGVIVLAMLVLAVVLNITAVIQVLDEYRLLGSWLERAGSESDSEVEALRQDIGNRIIVRSVASAVLLLCTICTLWLQQHQLAVRRALHEAKLLARDVLASLNQGVITTDRMGRITSINNAAIRLLEVAPDCIGQPIGSISSAEVPLEKLSLSVTERQQIVSDTELTLDRDSQVRRLLVSALHLKDDRGATIGCVIHLRDVTERMLMKEQMWRMEQFASLSTLASGLHHEIKNPITALSIHVQLLDERLRRTEMDPSISETIGVLKDEVQRLTLTLESFRNLASLQRLHLKRVDVQEVLEGVVRLVRPQAEGQGVRLELVPPERGLPQVALDSEKIGQAVLNLVLNALEAMPQGGDLTLRAAAENGELRLLVRDSGPGIPPEVQDHIFRPYFSTKDRGTGIGLTLAEKLVRQHRGHLDFRTGPTGTSFAITLPINEPHGSIDRP